MIEDLFVDPSRAHFEAFKALPRDASIHMLNLLRFKKIATYPDGHSHAARGLSGREAYGEYGRTSGPIFARVGGSIIWRGGMQALVIGPNDEYWDASFIACYPSAAAFLEMVTDPDYRIAVVHRQSAVLTSRLIRFEPHDGVGGAHFSPHTP